MTMQSRMTLIGLSRYVEHFPDEYPDGFWRYLTLPEDTLDKETLIDTILMRGGEYEVIYPNPDFMIPAMKSWSRKYANTIKRWFDAFNKDYNPIDNYDRHEEWTENKDGSHADSSDGNSTTNVDGSLTGSATDNETVNLVDEHKVSAFNSGAYEPEHQDSHTGTDNRSGTENQTTSEDTANEFEQSSQGTYEEDLVHSGHLFGNIGVTSSQELIMQEFELYKINLYDDVADLFLHDFVIPVN